jgi:hypothetical protein
MENSVDQKTKFFTVFRMTKNILLLIINLFQMARNREILDDIQRALIAFFKKNTTEEGITLREIASAI